MYLALLLLLLMDYSRVLWGIGMQICHSLVTGSSIYLANQDG